MLVINEEPNEEYLDTKAYISEKKRDSPIKFPKLKLVYYLSNDKERLGNDPYTRKIQRSYFKT